MALNGGVHILVSDGSRVAEARRAAGRLAAAPTWREDDRARAALVITEMASNLCKHAAGGELFLQLRPHAGGTSLHALAVDRGPGVADIARYFEDGYSTAGSSGTGLGAIRRLADHIDVYSTPAKGTVLFAAVGGHRHDRVGTGGLIVAGVSAPYPGESACGDAWAATTSVNRATVLVVDGLGHGPYAAAAAQAAVDTFNEAPAQEPVALVASMHERLRGTRGAAAAVATIDADAGVVRHCGVGNIAGCIVHGDDVRHLVSHDGTLGYSAPRIAAFERPWAGGHVLIMCSDGIRLRWKAGDWPGLWSHHPAVIAGVLYRDQARDRDDATVVAAKHA